MVGRAIDRLREDDRRGFEGVAGLEIDDASTPRARQDGRSNEIDAAEKRRSHEGVIQPFGYFVAQRLNVEDRVPSKSAGLGEGGIDESPSGLNRRTFGIMEAQYATARKAAAGAQEHIVRHKDRQLIGGKVRDQGRQDAIEEIEVHDTEQAAATKAERAPFAGGNGDRDCRLYGWLAKQNVISGLVEPRQIPEFTALDGVTILSGADIRPANRVIGSLEERGINCCRNGGGTIDYNTAGKNDFQRDDRGRDGRRGGAKAGIRSDDVEVGGLAERAI